MFGCYRLRSTNRFSESEDDWDYVAFPGTDCTCAEFRAAENDDYALGYWFDFHGDMLVEVTWSSY